MFKSKLVQKVLGKNINVGSNFSLYSKKKVQKLLSKYSIKVTSYNASLEKKKYLYRVKLNIILTNHTDIDISAVDKLPYKAFNLALLSLSKKIRRHIRRKKIIKKSRQEIINLKGNHLNLS